ncbi:MAG: S8 family serine peptidase, partial [Armatimonadota bacterium]
MSMRTWCLLGAGLVVGLFLVGCGGGNNQAPSPTIQPQGLAPIEANAAGVAKVIIGFRQQAGPSQQRLVEGYGGKVKYVYDLIPAIAASLPEQAVDALRRNPNVTYVEGDAQVYALEDELVWGADRVDAEHVWGGSEDAVSIATGALTGEGVKVAILDTGIYYEHPDLSANYVGGYDFINDDDDPMDDQGHGTHCAGIVGALDNQSGIIQVAPRVSLYAIKVLDASGSGYVSDIAAGLQWCVDNGIQVASMSFGGGDSKALHDACDAAFARDVVLVAAAGNSGNRAGIGDNVQCPARYSSVIAVAATGENDKRASFSSTGPTVELAAPGVSVKSTVLNNGYAVYSGTSMACPHVSGVAALVIDSGVTSAAAVRDRLTSTAEDL